MTTRKIEFTETVLIGTEQFDDGDRKSFPKSEADQYINLGWAKCVETGETGERKPGAQTITPDKATQKV